MNFKWLLHQVELKNAFLLEDLQEEVYMEILPWFGSEQTTGKMCHLKKPLYRPKEVLV